VLLVLRRWAHAYLANFPADAGATHTERRQDGEL
jgi:hypothetical protein